MVVNGTVLWMAFLLCSSVVLLISMLAGGRKNRFEARLNELSGQGAAVPEQAAVAQFTRATLPKMGAHFVPNDEEERSRLQARLVQAGLYNRQAMVLFLGVKMLLMVAPALIGFGVGSSGLLPMRTAVIGGALLGIVGMVGPSFWLDQRKKKRQTSFRRGLPDALDVIVICLEGGLSLPGAVRRVAGELRGAHPLLASELNIVQREVQLGKSAGEALRHFADRSNLEELRSLSAVVIQTERFGASLVKALRVHADTLRVKRVQRAEELAQKASTKILFPTLLFIFPGIFLVILGPAAIQIMAVFNNMR